MKHSPKTQERRAFLKAIRREINQVYKQLKGDDLERYKWSLINVNRVHKQEER